MRAIEPQDLRGSIEGMQRSGLVVLALVVDVGVAAASPCSGDSSDDWSAFDDDDDDDTTTTSSTQRVASGPPPLLHVELGFAMRQLASPLGTRTGSVAHEGEAFSYRVVNDRRARALDTAAAAQARVGVPLRYGLYAAAEAEIGTLTDHATSTEMTSSGTRGTPTLEQDGVTLLGGALVLGAAARLGRLSLGVEAAGGFHALVYSYESTYGACETTSGIVAAGGVLEGRARAAYWASPHVTVGLTAGKSMLDDGWMSGLYVGWHTTAFGR